MQKVVDTERTEEEGTKEVLIGHGGRREARRRRLGSVRIFLAMLLLSSERRGIIIAHLILLSPRRDLFSPFSRYIESVDSKNTKLEKISTISPSASLVTRLILSSPHLLLGAHGVIPSPPLSRQQNPPQKDFAQLLRAFEVRPRRNFRPCAGCFCGEECAYLRLPKRLFAMRAEAEFVSREGMGGGTRFQFPPNVLEFGGILFFAPEHVSSTVDRPGRCAS